MWWLAVLGVAGQKADGACYPLAVAGGTSTFALCAQDIGYLVLLKYNLSVFSCATFNGKQYLAFAPDDLCYTKNVSHLREAT
jgi:hypothetical protein